MLLEILTVVLLSTKVLCQQPVPIVIALNNEMNRYRRLADYAVQVSINISTIVTGMTEEVFKKSDEIEGQAVLLEETVVTKAQTLSTKSVHAADCVQNIMLSRSIGEMQAHVRQTTKCLLREADINSVLEPLITTELNHHRSHVIEGRRAMEMCALDPDPTSWTKCLNAISNELMEIETQTRAGLKKIQRQTIERRKYLPGKVRICEAFSSKFVKAMRENIDKIGRCEELSG